MDTLDDEALSSRQSQDIGFDEAEQPLTCNATSVPTELSLSIHIYGS